MSNLIIRKDIYGNDTVKIYSPANVYESAILGKGVQIGAFSEVGNNVVIGNGSKVGMGAFLCEGVIIGTNVFIAPRVTFTNDKHPPSTKEEWLSTIVEDEAVIGANATIRCGIRIGKKASIGCGAVVTKDVPAGEIWAGNPAKKLSKKL